jgi:hypothetical protein
VKEMVISCYGETTVKFTEMEADESIMSKLLDGLLRVHKDFTEEEKVYDYG